MAYPVVTMSFYEFVQLRTEEEINRLFFAINMINLSQDYDGYRQNPTSIKGNYYTDSSFKKIIEQFQQVQAPLFRTTDEVVYYDRKSWPDKSIQNLGEMSYSEAFTLLEK